MRKKLVAGNWKMNLTKTTSTPVVAELAKLIAGKKDVDVLLCPPYVNITAVQDAAKGSIIEVGAQDVFWKESGAFTGKISAGMLKDLGLTYCIVGHSETRGKFGKLDIEPEEVALFNETDHTVNIKIKALLANGIKPILCCGETLAEREAGKTDDVIVSQIKGGLCCLTAAELEPLVVAYEPVWAIGTGKTCDAEEANRVCGVVRKALADLVGADLAAKTRVLYGGSVNSTNSATLFAMSDIDGGLVGGASMKAEEFSKIVLSA
jgi:triosephosphate isomerase